MMTLYETHIVFLLSFIFPNIICAYPGSISSNIDELNVDGASFNTNSDPINFFPTENFYRELPLRPQQRYFVMKTIANKQLGYLKRFWPYLRSRTSGPFASDIDYNSWIDDSTSEMPTDTDYRYLNVEPTFKSTTYPDSEPYWIQHRGDRRLYSDGHFEIAKPETLKFWKRQSALSPPSRDWCRLMGFQVCPRET
ncbi:hypothetical protein ACF0H5_002973 [Mactra antiquata]